MGILFYLPVGTTVAAIISSEVILDVVQGNTDRRSIREEHLDHMGVYHYISYRADVGADETIFLDSHADSLWNSLIEAERKEYLINARVGISPEVPLDPDYAAIPALKKFLIRQGFIMGQLTESISLIGLINSLSDANIKNTVGISQARVNQMRARVMVLEGLDTDIQSDSLNIILDEDGI